MFVGALRAPTNIICGYLLEKMKRVDGQDVLFEKVCVVANPGAVHPG